MDKILDAQNPLSKGEGNEAHEEMLFIIIHQTYELWFKQIIHEIESVMSLLSKEKMDEENVGLVVGRFDRVNKILDILVKQLDFRHQPCNFVEIMPRLDEHLQRK